MKRGGKGFSQRGLTLQVMVWIILPLTVLMLVIAVGSIALHEQAMRAALPPEAWQSATNPALELTLVAPLVLVAPLIFSLAALWFGARQIVKPLQKLESEAALVASGDYDAIQEPVGGIMEVQHLQAELAEMGRKVQASHAALHHYISAITSAQEDERLRLARELHDETIQGLIVLKQRIEVARRSVNEPGAESSLGELARLVENTIEEVRRMTRALRPIYLEDLGLVPALEMLARETSQLDGLQVDFQRRGQERRLPAAVELSLYRIVQQALNNVVRHAKALHASVLITFTAGEIRVEVHDDGIGFVVPASTNELAARGHFGLLGMRERADLIGGRLEVASRPAGGTAVTLHLPHTATQPQTSKQARSPGV
jgi:signal transduction histidine kinase